MAFNVEDGTGKADATAYITVATFDAYWTDRGNQAALDAPDGCKETAIIIATDYIDLHFDWQGIRKTDTQALDWPRDGVIDFKADRVIDPDSVPQGIQFACAEIAAVALETDVWPNAINDTGQVLSESRGARGLTVSRTFSEISNSDPVLRKAVAWLAPLIAATGLLRA